jgi:protein-tyrosine phosphatase
MIDIHSHILSGVDDGASGLEGSLALARIYQQTGYQQVVATPHAELDSLPLGNFGKSLRTRVDRLNQHLEKQHLALKILTGMEVGLDPQLPEMVAQGKILTLADTKYLLVETPFSRLPLNWWEIVFLLASGGITVIFAHPERCAQVADNLELLHRILQAGAKFQVNWDSFTGAFGRKAADVARYMARKGFIHCLATDSHNATHRHAGNVRSIALQLKVLIGVENLRRIAVENPAKVIQGKTLLEMDPEEMPKHVRRKRFGKKMLSWTKTVRDDSPILGESNSESNGPSITGTSARSR